MVRIFVDYKDLALVEISNILSDLGVHNHKWNSEVPFDGTIDFGYPKNMKKLFRLIVTSSH